MKDMSKRQKRIFFCFERGGDKTFEDVCNLAQKTHPDLPLDEALDQIYAVEASRQREVAAIQRAKYAEETPEEIEAILSV